MIAVDASVAVKWLWREPGHEEARQLLKNATRLFAPAIIQLEVAGAVIRQYRNKLITESESHSLLAAWNRILLSGALQLVPNEELYDMGIAIAITARHALIDCLYVATGKEFDVPLLTADEMLHKRCKAVYGKVELLSSKKPH